MVPKRNYSALDMPGHLTLKTRQDGQGSSAEQSLTDFREELRREEEALLAKKRHRLPDESGDLPSKRFKVMDGGASSLKTPFPQDADERFSSSEDE